MNNLNFEHFIIDEDGNYFAGNHIVFDFWGVDDNICGNIDIIRTSIIDACNSAGATVLGDNFHHFGEGFGVTGVVMLSESHASIHTWPEANLMTLDVFMCGHANPNIALEYLKDIFKPTEVDVINFQRGKHKSRISNILV
jgi:S-adenosylmethionine decarboxylase